MRSGRSSAPKPRELSESSKARCERMLALVDRMLEYDKLSDAYRYVVIAEAIAGFDSGMLSQIKQKGEAVREAADALLEKGDSYCDEGDYAKAIEAYSQVSGLRKLGTSKTATRKLVQLERRPEVRASLREVRASQRLEHVLQVIDIASMQIEVIEDDEPEVCDAPDAEPAGAAEAVAVGMAEPREDAGRTEYAVFPSPDGAAAEGDMQTGAEDASDDLSLSEVEIALLLNLCERIQFIDALDSVADHYSDTASGERALRLAEDLRASAEFMDGLEEHRLEEQAMECVSMAKQYEQIGKLEIAAEMYREAVEASPESEWGIEAKKALIALKR